MRQMLVFQATFSGSSKSEVPSQAGKQIHGGRSLVEVLRLNSRATTEVGGLKLLSLQILDLFPVSIRFEKGIDGVEQCLAVDCYEMESSTLFFSIACKILLWQLVLSWEGRRGRVFLEIDG
jgi:hypothetical protein